MRYIEREKALKVVADVMSDCKVSHKHRALNRNIKQIPTADVAEVRHGEWLPTNIPTMFSGVIHECSICKAKDGEHSSILGYYCWRCGAKMDGERRTKDAT